MNSIEYSILDNMTEGMLTIDGNGKIMTANQAACDILGFPPEDMINASIGSLFFWSKANDDFNQLILYSSEQPEKNFSGTVTFETSSEIKNLQMMTRSGISASTGISIMACFSDVTELVRKQGLNASLEELRKLNHSLQLRKKLIETVFGRYVLHTSDTASLSDTINSIGKGKRRSVTIMQSDLRGFTAISNRMDPGNLVFMINNYLTEMTIIIQKHNGMIVQFMGDGILSVFGSLEGSDTQYDDAIAAAIEMQQKMPEVNSWNIDHGYNEHLKMGIGLDCGEAVIGFLGEELRQFNVIGHVVGRADEIQGNTIEGQILISPELEKSCHSTLTVSSHLALHLPHSDEDISSADVTGIGAPYNLTRPVINSSMRKALHPADVRMYIINGKCKSDVSVSGKLIELSDSEAIVASDEVIPVMTNIQIDIGEPLYAKITGIDGINLRMSLTAIPPAFSTFCNSLF